MRIRAAALVVAALLSVSAAPASALARSIEAEPARATAVVEAPGSWFAWLWNAIHSVFAEDRGEVMP
jgi:hypothetical protein